VAHFYGVMEGNRGRVTRCGSKDSGLGVHAASWSGSVRVYLFVQGGANFVRVELAPWHGAGVSRELYHGPIGEYRPDVLPDISTEELARELDGILEDELPTLPETVEAAAASGVLKAYCSRKDGAA
jgi:hypothetical protein